MSKTLTTTFGVLLCMSSCKHASTAQLREEASSSHFKTTVQIKTPEAISTPFIPQTFEFLEKLDSGTEKQYYDYCVKELSKFDEISIQKIEYKSNDLTVSGIFAINAFADGTKKIPAIIFNRGGNRNFGLVDACTIGDTLVPLIKQFAKNNIPIAIFATNYRGNDGEKGKEEFGGADLEDVSSLLNIVRSLPFIDSKNIFMHGHSRGGMMTYLALKNQFPLNAASITGGIANLFTMEMARPVMKDVFRDLIPNSPSSGQPFANCFGPSTVGWEKEVELLSEIAGGMYERSATCWIEKIKTPLLIQHGTNDEAVPFADAQLVAKKLEDLKPAPFKFVSYPGENHFISDHKDEEYQQIYEWFKANMR